MEIVNYIILGISFIGYIIVYRIQKSLYTKQNDIMNSYKEVLKIMSLDEIKKHVALKEENLKLNFSNREKKLKDFEKKVGSNLVKSKDLLGQFKDFKEREQEMDKLKDKADFYLEKGNNQIESVINVYEQLVNLNEEEFNEIYDFINRDLKSVDEFKGLFFENNLLAIRNEYVLKRTELLKNREKLN